MWHLSAEYLRNHSTSFRQRGYLKCTLIRAASNGKMEIQPTPNSTREMGRYFFAFFSCSRICNECNCIFHSFAGAIPIIRMHVFALFTVSCGSKRMFCVSFHLSLIYRLRQKSHKKTGPIEKCKANEIRFFQSFFSLQRK